MTLSAAEPVVQNAYLQLYLDPLRALLDDPEVTDIFVNRAGEAWAETVGGNLHRHELEQLNETALWRLARQIAAAAYQGVSREHPLLAATLPDGARVQIIAPPATRGHIAIAIRKHVFANLSLEDLAKSGAFSGHREGPGARSTRLRAKLGTLLEKNDLTAFLRTAVKERQNIVISGGTSSGKTTFVNALLREVPSHERLVIIEDAPELQFTQANTVGLVGVKGELGETLVTADDLMQASLRMRPDRIILGELRGKEAFSFVRAANTGHPGSITTIHADTPAGALSQMSLMMLQAGTNLSRNEATAYIEEVVDVWVQLSRRDGRRVVSDIRFAANRR